MSNKFDSMLKILNKIHGKELVTVKSLVNDLGMKERTVLRYIKSLKEADFQIVYDREKNGYCFSEGFTLRKPSISLEETLTLALAKKVLGTYGSEIGRTLGKIEEKVFDRQSSIPDRIVASAPALPEKISSYLGTILQAIMDYRRIEIRYASLYGDELTTRKIEPCYIFFEDGFFNVRAYCQMRKGYRTFAVDRIALMKPLDEHFLPHGLSPEEEMSGAFGAFVDGDPVDVVLRFDKDIEARVLRKKWHASQKKKVLPDGRLEFSFVVNGLDGILRWIYQWIPHVEVVAPEELRARLIGDAGRVLERHEPGTQGGTVL